MNTTVSPIVEPTPNQVESVRARSFFHLVSTPSVRQFMVDHPDVWEADGDTVSSVTNGWLDTLDTKFEYVFRLRLLWDDWESRPERPNYPTPNWDEKMVGHNQEIDERRNDLRAAIRTALNNNLTFEQIVDKAADGHADRDAVSAGLRPHMPASYTG